MAIKALSPSAMGKFLDCPRCFWLTKNGVKDYRGIMASLPNGIDDVLKDYHDEYRVKGLLPPEVAVQIPDSKPFADLLKLTQWRTLGKGIKAVVDGIPVVGLLDDIMGFVDDTVAGYDYKSNKSPREPEYAANFYEHQGDIYNLLLGENGYKTRPFTYFSFWSPKPLVPGTGNAETRTALFPFDCTVHRIEADAARARDLVKRAADCLSGGLPEPASDCEMCAYTKARGLRLKDIVAAQKAAAEAAAQSAPPAPAAPAA